MPTVLLVEDEEAHRELIIRAFEQSDESITVVSCSTLQQTGQYLASAHANDLLAVIVDWNLPDGSGIDLVRHITLDVPLLMMTSYGNEAMAVEAMKSGAMDYVVKSPEEFRRMPTIVQRVHREWTNIQQRKIFEIALRSREAQLRAMMNNTNDPIWSVDTHYCLLAFNTAFQLIFTEQIGTKPILGASVVDMLPEKGLNRRSLWKERYDLVLNTRKRLVFEHHDVYQEQTIFFEVAFNPVMSNPVMSPSDNEVVGIVVFTHNITEQKRTERVLREREERINTALQEKSRLLEELEQQKHKTLQAVVEGQEHERSRIAKDLHDGVGQMLSVVKISVSAIQEQLLTIAPEQAAQLRESIALLDSAVQEVRAVSHQLMPIALRQLGLQAAIEDICSSIRARTSITIDVELSALAVRLNPVQELTLYRILQELLNNTLKYGQATRVSIQAIREGSSLLLMYEDDGKGFDKDTAHQGIGLNNILSRAAMLGGTAELYSTLGNGMVATIDIPVVATESVLNEGVANEKMLAEQVGIEASTPEPAS
jgi:PAS domain S-box-containing protein